MLGGPFLGACVDGETNGQPLLTAIGDDQGIGTGTLGTCLANDDEDGVVIGPLSIGATNVPVPVTANGVCTLNGWIDWNRDGDWSDAGEQVFAGQALVNGANNLTLNVPNGASVGAAYARFRCTTDATFNGSPHPTGQATDGEVEDYVVTVNATGAVLDYGDAPDPSYPTLAGNNGAAHVLSSAGPRLGVCVDGEANGQPNAAANGDDTTAGSTVFGTCAASDDEDGVIINSSAPFAPGATNVPVSVTASTPCTLNAWIDWNRDGDWLDEGEQVFSDQALTAGANALSMTIPGTASSGTTYARFRCTTDATFNASAAPTGVASNGEVEDYVVLVLPSGAVLDWGDAPDPTYPTLATNNGAAHIVTGPYLGTCVDSEANGQPNSSAASDDTASGGSVVGTCANNDDEDGVSFGTIVQGASGNSITVTASAPCILSGWIDWNQDGDWQDAGEQVVSGQTLTAGSNSLTVSSPTAALSGTTYARFRCTTDAAFNASPQPTGIATNGEVEDYAVVVSRAYSLGNRVWLDNGAGGGVQNDGMQNGSEPGLANVVVGLYADANSDRQPDSTTPVLPVQSTDGNGHYLFITVQEGKYVVRIESANFTAGGVLASLVSSTGAIDSASNSQDRKDNGVDNASPQTQGIVSGTVMVGPGANAPTGETDIGTLGTGGKTDDRSNLTVDFGFVPGGTPTGVVDLAVTKAGPPAIAVGIPFNYTVTVHNLGTAPATNVVLTETLGGALQVLDVRIGRITSCAVANPVVCNLGTIPVGGTITVIVQAQASSIGTFPCSAVINASEVETVIANNVSDVTVQVVEQTSGPVTPPDDSPIAAIPTLSEWGLPILATLLAALSWRRLRQSR